MELDDLIAALASPPGPSATGIVRISGGCLRTVLEACFQPDDASDWTVSSAPRRFAGKWRLTDSPLRLPCQLMFWPSSRSYAGQPTAEVHLPGSPPLLERVLEDLDRRGVRSARPGEFTLRAFLAGKIDLVQAEAVLGVIDAGDDAELRTALDQLAGGISFRLAELRAGLIDLLADLEAGLDFVEEDIEFVTRAELLTRIVEARKLIDSLLQQSSSRMTSRTTPKVALAGLPNAGKSTLFNRLAGESLALVSDEKGTTRDYLRAEIAWNGIALELIDTAGWEESHEGIAGAAQHQRADQCDRAALIVWCTASDQTWEQQEQDAAAFAAASGTAPILRVQTKCDISVPSGGHEAHDCGPPSATPIQEAYAPRSEELSISAAANTGLDELRARITNLLAGPAAKSSAWLGMTAARCGESLQRARSALLRAEAAAQQSASEELLAVDLRDALDELGVIIGAVYTDDLLDRIFSKFCIGK